jgi:hypothetical protein
MGKIEDALKTMAGNLEEKTGTSLAGWVKRVRAEKLDRHGAIVAFLKSTHGLGHGYANLVANAALSADTPAAAEDPVAAQFAGAKAALRPLYDGIIAAVGAFGSDIEVSPKKAYVSLRRSRQFAIVQPSTASRLDVGLNLKGVAPAGRLEASGSFNAMVSHRVRLAPGDRIDKELIGWLRRAYDAA